MLSLKLNRQMRLVIMGFTGLFVFSAFSPILSSLCVAEPLESSFTYIPLVECNDQEVTFYQTYFQGTSVSPAQGILAVSPKISEGNGLVLEAIEGMQGTLAVGFTFSTINYGTIKLDINGKGSLAHDVCTQNLGVVSCVRKTISLYCRYIPNVPSGFSAGN